NVVREAAWLARLPIRALGDVRQDELEGLIIPGGYGPVVNFSTGFARPGQACSVRPEVAEFLRHFLETGKPIGCVSLGEIPVRTVLGEELKVPVPAAGPLVLSVDPKRAIVHTPGFTTFTRLRDVKEGIEAMLGEVIRIIRERRAAASAAPGMRNA